MENNGVQVVRSNYAEIAIRIFAGILALIASFFGLLLFAIFHWEGSLLRVMWFLLTCGPGYLVTAGYIWRAFSHPTYRWRVAIWIASILVQGTWLAISLFDGYPNIGMLWWFCSCVGSVIALAAEPKT